MSRFTLRAYRPADRAAVLRLQADTLFLGAPLPFPVEGLDGLLAAMSDYYLEREPEHAWVAEDDLGRVAGYLLLTIHPARESAHRLAQLRPLLARLALRWRRLDAFSRLFWRLRARDVWEVIRHPEPELPAVVHWNMLPAARLATAQQIQYLAANACLEAGIPAYGGGLTVEERHRQTAWRLIGGEPLAEGPNHTLSVLAGRPIFRVTVRIDAADMLARTAWRPATATQPAQPPPGA
ncbi:MAG TPA: hypothetical protein DCZ72_11160 [Armatimonadetes bacterium]|nr:hypothetical protein [Armatimonadota bacterium]